MYAIDNANIKSDEDISEMQEKVIVDSITYYRKTVLDFFSGLTVNQIHKGFQNYIDLQRDLTKTAKLLNLMMYHGIQSWIQ